MTNTRAPRTMLAILAALAALLLLAACGGDEIDESLTSLKAGDCIAESNLGAIETVDTIDCTESGAVEVVAVFEITGFDDEYPGDDVVATEAADGCPSSTTLNLVPTEDSWTRGDDRQVVCFADPGSGGDDDDSGDDDSGDDTGDDDDAADDDSGDDAAAGAGGDDTDVCALASEDEIQDILGEPVTADDDGSGRPFYQCTWQAESFTTAYVTVYVDDQDTLEEYFGFTENAEEIDGLGDRAQWSPTLGVLEILVEDYDLTVQLVDLTGNEDDVVLANATAIAELILERLDR